MRTLSRAIRASSSRTPDLWNGSGHRSGISLPFDGGAPFFGGICRRSMIKSPPTLTFEAGRIDGVEIFHRRKCHFPAQIKLQTGYHSTNSSQCEIGTPIFKIRRSACMCKLASSQSEPGTLAHQEVAATQRKNCMSTVGSEASVPLSTSFAMDCQTMMKCCRIIVHLVLSNAYVHVAGTGFPKVTLQARTGGCLDAVI
jgi:hypothetical protein